MTARSERSAAQQPVPLKISRNFHVAPSVVFKAWSSAEHIKRWFCPANCTIPEAQVEMRVGGPFEVHMLAEGIDRWTRGTFVEISPDERLVLDLHVFDGNERALLSAWTEVNFTSVLGGTRLDVVQTYTMERPAEAARAIELASRGWSETLDRLEKELAHMRGGGNTKRSAEHARFTLKRSYDAPVARVFRAFADMNAKTEWFGGAEGHWKPLEREMDFRVGGRERLQGRWDSGIISTFDAVYHDIIPEERIIYSYEMHLDDRKISVSLGTIEFRAESPGRTALTLTEQAAFLDGYHDAGSREQGTGFLLDRLGASLKT